MTSRCGTVCWMSVIYGVGGVSREGSIAHAQDVSQMGNGGVGWETVREHNGNHVRVSVDAASSSVSSVHCEC